MRKILTSAVILFAFSLLYAAAGIKPGIVTGNKPFDQIAQNPGDVVWVTLHDNLPTASDSFKTADTVQLYGPYALAKDNKDCEFKSFRVYFQGGLANGDSVDLAYQIIPGSKMSDTVTSAWTVVDTFAVGGKYPAQVDISAKPGRAIVFKITNIDATESDISDWVRVAFRRNATINVNEDR